jgi:hypothetical protein
MTPQEKDLTTILLDRLNKTEGQKDPEAEALIRQATAERHGAPYYLVQTVLIQDLSLHNAQRRITDLETQLTETKLNSSAAPSFLGGPSSSAQCSTAVNLLVTSGKTMCRQVAWRPAPLRSRRCSNRVLFPSPPTRHLSLLAPD